MLIRQLQLFDKMLTTCQIPYDWSCLITIREKAIHNHFATFQHLFHTKLTTHTL